MSELAVGSLKGLAANDFKIEVASGSQLVQPGAILQVVSATKTDTFSTTSTSYVDLTGMSASITPSSTNSKIMVFVSLTYGVNTVNVAPKLQLLRDATVVGGGAVVGSRASAMSSGWSSGNSASMAGSAQGDSTLQFLDSPSTTSATIYKVQGYVNTGTFYLNRSDIDTNSAASEFARTSSTITLMEVAG